WIFPVSSGVSLVGPLGPLRAGSSPASPFSRYAETHRHTVTWSVPSAAATCFCVAAFSCVTCTAASRRAASSPASQVKVAMPCTHTWPPPSGRASRPTPGAISCAPPGSHGSGDWISLLPAITPPVPDTASILSKPGGPGEGNEWETKAECQLSRLITIRQRTAMSGALGLFDLNPAGQILAADSAEERGVVCGHVAADHPDYLVIAVTSGNEPALATDEFRHRSSYPVPAPMLLRRCCHDLGVRRPLAHPDLRLASDRARWPARRGSPAGTSGAAAVHLPRR